MCEQCSLSLCSPRCRAVFFQRSRCAVHARLFQERVRVLPAAAAGSPRGAGAHCTPEPPASPGTGFWRPGVVGTGCSVRHRVLCPAQGGVALPASLSPSVAPGCAGMLCPCAGCAVAMEIACAVARQLKHPRLHTAMPRNAQLSSFLSPFCDLADMTPLALSPLHSVARLRFLGVNPVNPKKPAWHCK